MPITDEVRWEEWQESNKDDYGGAIVAVAERVMAILDAEPDMIDARGVILRANADRNAGGLSGFQVAAVATTIESCHSRGSEFAQAFMGEGG